MVAADLDPRFLGGISAGNVEVRRCDVTRDPLEPTTYDLIHARALLTHMREPLAVLQRLVDALRPEGWLVVEEPDYDEQLGMPGLHTVRPEVTYEERAACIPPDLFAKYAKTSFWSQEGLNTRGITVL